MTLRQTADSGDGGAGCSNLTWRAGRVSFEPVTDLTTPEKHT